MTRTELLQVKKVLERITNKTGQVELAIALVNKDLAIREAQRDNFKGEYDGDFINW